MKNSNKDDAEHNITSFIAELERLKKSFNGQKKSGQAILAKKFELLVQDIKNYLPDKLQNVNITDMENSGPEHITSVVKFLNSMQKTIQTYASEAPEVTKYEEKIQNLDALFSKLDELSSDKNTSNDRLRKHKIKWEIQKLLKTSNLSTPHGFKYPIGIPSKDDINQLKKIIGTVKCLHTARAIIRLTSKKEQRSNPQQRSNPLDKYSSKNQQNLEESQDVIELQKQEHQPLSQKNTSQHQLNR
ncbi:MAG: hypothetical protein VX112_04105 [Pseudomonadota bacterium]|nr:hypothetical protein [Pseudomonadota bacterium]